MVRSYPSFTLKLESPSVVLSAAAARTAPGMHATTKRERSSMSMQPMPLAMVDRPAVLAASLASLLLRSLRFPVAARLAFGGTGRRIRGLRRLGQCRWDGEEPQYHQKCSDEPHGSLSLLASLQYYDGRTNTANGVFREEIGRAHV